MKTEVIKKSNRGGYKTRKRLYSSQARFLSALCDAFEGPGRLEYLTGIAAQRFVNWKLQGKVSLKRIKSVSDKLEVSGWLLNYAEIADIVSSTNSPIPKWPTLIKECEWLTTDQKEYILKGKLP